MHSPWTNFFPIDNQNDTFYTKADGSSYPGDWHLGLTAIPPSGGLNYVNMSVLTIWFHIDKDPCFPSGYSGTFALTGQMSGDGSVPIPTGEFDGGSIELIPVQPKITMKTTDAAYNATTNTITEKCESHTFDIEIDAINVTNFYGFGLLITYDCLHLETDPQSITPKPAFAGPYEYAEVIVGPSAAHGVLAGQVLIVMFRPSEKPGICGALIPLVDIVFHTIDTAYDDAVPDQLPVESTSTITLTWAFLQAKCFGGVAEYDYPSAAAFAPNGLGINFGYPGWWMYDLVGMRTLINYDFKPSIYDLNLDCVVDVNDLKALIYYYPGSSAAGGWGDLYPNDGTGTVIDIFDFVAIAKNFGTVDP